MINWDRFIKNDGKSIMFDKKGNFRKSKRIHFAIENLKRIDFGRGEFYAKNSVNRWFTKIPEVKRKELAKKKNYSSK